MMSYVTNFREKVFRKQEPPSCTICNQNMIINCTASSLRFKSQKRRHTAEAQGWALAASPSFSGLTTWEAGAHHLSVSLDLVLLGGTQDVRMSHRGQNRVIENNPK